MAHFSLTLDLPVHVLPDGFLAEHKIPADYVEDGMLLDAEIDVEFNPGYYVPAKLSGHPDSWAPAEGEDHELVSVTLSEWADTDIVRNLDTETEQRIIEGIGDEPDEPDYDPDDYDGGDDAWMDYIN